MPAANQDCAQGAQGRLAFCAPNYCRRYRPAARHAQPVDTSTWSKVVEFTLQGFGPFLHWLTLGILCVMPILAAFIKEAGNWKRSGCRLSSHPGRQLGRISDDEQDVIDLAAREQLGGLGVRNL
jgi:hypothetical protein